LSKPDKAVDAYKERNLGIILLEPNGSLIPASVDSQVIHVLMHDATYRHIEIKKGETSDCPSILAT
jgi:hypothetical protein